MNPLKTSFISPLSPTSPSDCSWLKYAMASFFFGAVGQFAMGFLSQDITSRFIISLGNLIFVVFFAIGKLIHFYYKEKRIANLSDCSWFDQNGVFKIGLFKHYILGIITRFIYGFSIIIAFSEARAQKMNLGIILSVRSSEALFVAGWTFFLLKEKLSLAKLLGLFILTGGVAGLSLPKGSGDDGFSLSGILWLWVQLWYHLLEIYQLNI